MVDKEMLKKDLERLLEYIQMLKESFDDFQQTNNVNDKDNVYSYMDYLRSRIRSIAFENTLGKLNPKKNARCPIPNPNIE
jgi:hypothetical protein